MCRGMGAFVVCFYRETMTDGRGILRAIVCACLVPALFMCIKKEC